MKTLAIVLFVATYGVMIFLPRFRVAAAVSAACLFLVTGVLPVGIAAGYVDLNVLMLLAGTMGLVALFTQSGMPARMAEVLLEKAPSGTWAAVFLCLLAGIVSAVVDNVATVLMIAPVGLEAARRLKISPKFLLIAIAVSANLQGAATLVGDSTSVMLGSWAGMDFFDFFGMEGRAGIFWVVQVGALATLPAMLVLFRGASRPEGQISRTPVTDPMPSVLLVSCIGLLIASSLLPNRPSWTAGAICMGMFLLGAGWNAFRSRGFGNVKAALGAIDLHTLLLLLSLFLLVGGLTETGVVSDLSRLLIAAGGGSRLRLYAIIVVGSVILSAFVDNIPYVAAMLPVIGGAAAATGTSPYLFYFGLLLGATLGGNLTPIGASANVAVSGILRREGCAPTSQEFAKVGVPMTLSAVAAGSVLCWFIWH